MLGIQLNDHLHKFIYTPGVAIIRCKSTGIPTRRPTSPRVVIRRMWLCLGYTELRHSLSDGYSVLITDLSIVHNFPTVTVSAQANESAGDFQMGEEGGGAVSCAAASGSYARADRPRCF